MFWAKFGNDGFTGAAPNWNWAGCRLSKKNPFGWKALADGNDWRAG